MMGFLGAIFGYAGMFLADGNGWSPLVFLLIGILLGGILADRAVRGVVGGTQRAMRLVVHLAAILVISMGLSRLSIWIDPARAYETALGVKVPDGVSNLHAWRQWYDGQNYVLSFVADESVINGIVNATGHTFYAHDQEAERLRGAAPSEFQNQLSLALVVPMFDLNRLEVTHLSSPHVWFGDWKDENGHDGAIQLVWDADTHRAILARYWS